MTLEEFKKAKIEKMKNHDKDGVNALNVLINKIMLATIEKRAQGNELTEADVVSLLQKTEKELLEEKESFEKAGRQENVDSLNNQIKTIQEYMPKLLSKEEVKTIILSLTDRSVPAVMRHFKTEYAGKCDMRVVNEVLKSL